MELLIAVGLRPVMKAVLVQSLNRSAGEGLSEEASPSALSVAQSRHSGAQMAEARYPSYLVRPEQEVSRPRSRWRGVWMRVAACGSQQ